MRGVFDDREDEELERPQQSRDPEVTLGSGTLLLLFFGLVLICGLCFGLGYAVGHHGPQQPTAVDRPPAPASPQPRQASGSPKPSATAQPAAAHPAAAQPAPSAPPNVPQPSAASHPQPALPTPTPTPAAPAPPRNQPQVRPALPPPASAPLTASTSHAAQVVPPVVPLMVQVAAVSHKEDADVLVGALANRGYAVTARRQPGDNLIHVCIGPFNNRDEATRWRIKLLNDGYNAMILP